MTRGKKVGGNARLFVCLSVYLFVRVFVQLRSEILCEKSLLLFSFEVKETISLRKQLRFAKM
jgi:hypothetical protein